MGKNFSRLRTLRKAKGLRQLDLVIATGLSPATIWIAEHGDSISLKTRKKIAKVLKVRPEDIWPDDSKKNSDKSSAGAYLEPVQFSAKGK